MGDEPEVIQPTGDTNNGEGETPAAPPSDESTPPETTPTDGGDGSEEKYVPYTRFKEVNERGKELEAKIRELETKVGSFTAPKEEAPKVNPELEAAKQKLRELGFVSQDDVKAEIKRVQQDTELERTLSSLESKYDGTKGLPKFDRKEIVRYAIEKQIANPEVAYKALYEKEILNWHITEASKKASGIKTETSNGSGAKEVGPSQDDLNQKMAAGDKSALDTVIRRSSLFKTMMGK